MHLKIIFWLIILSRPGIGSWVSVHVPRSLCLCQDFLGVFGVRSWSRIALDGVAENDGGGSRNVFVRMRTYGAVELDGWAAEMTESWGLECSVFSRSGQRHGSRVRRRGSRSDGVFESSLVNINWELVWGTETVGWFSCVLVYGWCSYVPQSCSLLHKLE